MDRFWSRVEWHLARGKCVFIAIVAQSTEHSPGTAGARLAVPDGEDPLGTIGGGVMEHDVIELARQALASQSFTPCVRTLVHREDELGLTSGLLCAGEQTNVYGLCIPARDGPVIRAAAEAQRNQDPALLSFGPDGWIVKSGGEDFHSQQRLESEGSAWRYVEQMVSLRRVAIMGGGHCGRALSRVLSEIGYHVQVFDTRQALATPSANPHADRIHVVNDFADAGPMVDHPGLTDVIVMTSAADTDIRALLGVLDRPFRFVGAMGSKSKVARIQRALAERGHGEQARRGITAPVGIAIGSHTPEEIAVSVAAQLIYSRNAAAA